MHATAAEPTYDNERVSDPGNDIESILERQGQVAEHAAHHVDEHEHQGYADDFLVLVNFVVLRASDRLVQMHTPNGPRSTHSKPPETRRVLAMPKNRTGALLPALEAGCGDPS